MSGTRGFTGVPLRLWRLVSLAHHRLLMLDHDGTLAPFRDRRDEARPLPRFLPLLGRLSASGHTRVAVISGRPVAELVPLLGALPIALVGEHGWEERTPEGAVLQAPLPDGAPAALDEAERRARAAGLGARLERKRTALTLHVRGLEPSVATRLVSEASGLWSGIEPRTQLRLDAIDGGLELRVRGRDKGSAALALLAQSPPGTLAVYVGDDTSDEDAFAVVREWGFGVRVGATERESLAGARLADSEELARFLETWLSLLERKGRAAERRGRGPSSARG